VGRTGKRRDERIRRGRKRDEHGVRSERKNKRLFSFATAAVDLVYECYVDDSMCLGRTPNVGQGRRHSGRRGGGELSVKFWALDFIRGRSQSRSAVVHLFPVCLIKRARRSHDRLRGGGYNEMVERFILPKTKTSAYERPKPSRQRTIPTQLVTQSCVRGGVRPPVYFSHVMAFIQ